MSILIVILKLELNYAHWPRCIKVVFDHKSEQGDSRNVSRPLGRNPSKVKLVFKALQTAGKVY